MPKRALWRLSATEMQGRYRDGSLTPLEVAQAWRGWSVNPRLNAVVARRDPAFMEEAEAATERFVRGAAVAARRHPAVGEGQPLHRRPADHLGLPGAARRATGHDELSVGRARAAGALIIGKTNVPSSRWRATRPTRSSV